jgi:hypothetical protein
VNGNFTRVNRQGASKIKVEGWLAWDAGDEGADLSIAVTQNAVTVSGSKHFENGEDTWDIVIELDGGTFSEGFASGLAGAVVATSNGSATQNWYSGPIPVH